MAGLVGVVGGWSLCGSKGHHAERVWEEHRDIDKYTQLLHVHCTIQSIIYEKYLFL